MKNFLNITKALSDKGRVRILMAMESRELCVCQIIEFLNLSPSTVSKHLSILYQAGLIDQRKEGRWVYYRLVEDGSSETQEALNWTRQVLRKDQTISEDRKLIRKILKMDLDEICKKIANKSSCC